MFFLEHHEIIFVIHADDKFTASRKPLERSISVRAFETLWVVVNTGFIIKNFAVNCLSYQMAQVGVSL